MKIEVRVMTDIGFSYVKRIKLHEEVPLVETENVLRHVFNLVVKEIVELREETNNG